MKIYKEEKFIQDRILASKAAKASMILPIKTTEDRSDLLINSLESVKKNNDTIALNKAFAQIANEVHPDLMYGSAILVSTVMNKNDDVFLPEEVWTAKNTIVNQPYNDQHIEIDIIGHIIAARPLDQEGNLVQGNEPPGYFDIEVDFVVYKSIFPTIAKDIYENAPKGKKFVSMECKFKDFDYALVDMDTKAVKLVDRNEDTAFLTKYLSAYGGEGIYKNYKIGRVLKQLRFSGMGNVDTPANPASEYTKIENFLLAASVDNESNSKVALYVTKGKIMKKFETLEEAVAEIDNLLAEVNDLKSKQSQAEVDEKVSALESEKSALVDELEGEKTKVEIAQNEIQELKNQKTEIETQLASVKSELETKNNELSEIQKATKSAERYAKLKELGYEVTDENKEKIANFSDETFASIVEFTSLKSSKEEGSEEDKGNLEEGAEEALSDVEEDGQASVEDTGGDTESDAEKIQKTAAKLIERVRAGNGKKGSKSKKKE